MWNHTNLEKIFQEQPELKAASNQGLPLPWESLDPASGNRFELNTGDAANSWQSVEIMGTPQPPASIKQKTLTLFCLDRELSADVPPRIDLGKFRSLPTANLPFRVKASP